MSASSFPPLVILLGLFAFVTAQAATLVVPDDHATIQAAIDAAREGDTVVVHPGTYKERIRLKPALTVRSAGDDARRGERLKRAEETIIDGSGEVAGGREAVAGVAMAEGSTLDGFTVTGVGTYDEKKWQEHFATRGSNQRHDEIGHFGTPGIGADGVNCRIVNNIVHHNGHTGIAIRGAEGAAVQPEVKANHCYRNMGGGIGIMHGAKGTISENICFENFYAGIGHNGASPLVEKNRCYGNIRAGIGISEGACPVVRGNECYGNRRAGIGTRTGVETAPTIEANDCHENGMAGIGTDEGAAPLILRNRCFRNALAGIGSQGNSRPQIVENEVRENKLAGIGFDECDAGKATVRGNRVIDNALVAIGVHAGWSVEIVGNELARDGGLPPMIMVFAGAEATVRENNFAVSGVAGVRVAGTAHVTNNTFDGKTVRKGGPPHFGVWALEGSAVAVSGNRFKSLRHALHASGATVSASGNVAEDFSAVAFVIQHAKGVPNLRDNTAVSADPKAVAVQVDGNAVGGHGNVVRAPE